MATQKRSDDTVSLDTIEINREELTFCLVGDSPLICNAMSEKVRQQLLVPPPRKNAAEKAMTLKHNPVGEFRGSMYRSRDPGSPTEIVMPFSTIKSSLASVALDMPGVAKTQLKRLIRVVDMEIPIWGIPKLFMAVTRNSDMGRTPDIRTRAILPKWATKVTLWYPVPLVRRDLVAKLIVTAGWIQGLGDWRLEKGGSYGAYRVCDADDAEYLDLVENAGRHAQVEAIENAGCYDKETEGLMAWYEAEVRRQGKAGLKVA